MNLDVIYPLIVPSSYVSSGVWDLPHHTFPNSGYVLTWVFFSGETTMSYINRQEFEILNSSYPNWQQYAFENLRNSLGKGGHFYTSYRASEKDQGLSFIIFSNEDGIGSSRILLSYELEKAFPDGYLVAMPDRSVGMVISKTLDRMEQKALKKAIAVYFGCTGTAMSRKIMRPTDFALPPIWLKPIDADLSEWIINEILSYNQ